MEVGDKTMPQIKSAKKRVRQIKKRTARNRAWKEKLKASRKLLLSLIEKKGNPDEIKMKLSLAYKVIDKAVKSGIIKKRKAARLKSKLSIKASEGERQN